MYQNYLTLHLHIHVPFGINNVPRILPVLIGTRVTPGPMYNLLTDVDVIGSGLNM